MKVLVLNSGSSSQKSSLYEIGSALPESPSTPTWEGKIEWKGNDAEIDVRTSHGASLRDRRQVASRAEAIEQLLDTSWKGSARVLSAAAEIDVAGHRVVHGGQQFKEPTIITPEVKSAIASMSVFAPLHNRAELEGIEIVEKTIGAIPQVAVFDTSFHSDLPEAAAVYPGPYEWVSRGSTVLPHVSGYRDFRERKEAIWKSLLSTWEVHSSKSRRGNTGLHATSLPKTEALTRE